MQNVFDVVSFGAVADGITDSTAAVQKALDCAAECCGKVVVPPGVYSVGHLHMHGQGVTLEGTSAWSFRSDGASVFCLNTADTDCMLDITGAFGCAVRGMCLNGNLLGECVHGIGVKWEQYNGGSEEDTPLIDDCRIGNFSGDGLHLEHIWCFSVRHSMIHNNRFGLFIDGWDAFVLDNWFTNNRGGGIVGGPYVASVTCTGNRVEWNRAGGFILPRGDSINITGNFFDRSFGPALLLGGENSGISLATVTGNIFRRSGAYEDAPFEDAYQSCHLRMTGCSGITVTGNAMKLGQGDGGSGVISPDYSMVIKDCSDCIIKDNTMANGAIVKNSVFSGDLSTCVIADNVGYEKKD